MKKILSIAVAAVLLIMTVVGCDNESVQKPQAEKFKVGDIRTEGILPAAIEVNSHVVYKENDALYLRNSNSDSGEKIADMHNTFAFDGLYIYYISGSYYEQSYSIQKLSVKDGTLEEIYHSDKGINIEDSYSKYLLCSIDASDNTLIVSREGEAFECKKNFADIIGIYNDKLYYPYSNGKSTSIYVSDLDGSNQKELVHYNGSFRNHMSYRRALIIKNKLYYVTYSSDTNTDIYAINCINLDDGSKEIIKSQLSGGVYLWYDGYTYGDYESLTFESFDGSIKVDSVFTVWCHDDYLIVLDNDKNVSVVHNGKVSEFIQAPDSDNSTSYKVPASYAGGKAYYSNDKLGSVDVIFR